MYKTVSSSLFVALTLTLQLGVCAQTQPVGKGARLFVTKCYPERGHLTQADFQQLADAGFTVVVNRWVVDLPMYCQLAGQAQLDVMSWHRALANAEDPSDQTLTREGKTTRYTRPTSKVAWERLTKILCEEAEISLRHPNLRGAILDLEIYDRNKTDGFCESFDDYSMTSYFQHLGRRLPDPLPDPDQRYAYLKDLSLLGGYITYQYELIAQHVRDMRRAVDAINPRFQIGMYGWGSMTPAILRYTATDDAPALDLDANTYGRTQFSGAFQGGYDANCPDRVGLKWSLLAAAQRVKSVEDRDYPVVALAGHNTQSPGPADGTQFLFTIKQAFNSTAYADGYWIWTEWGIPEGWAGTRQEWIDAVMEAWGPAHAALDRGDWTWANRQPEQVVNPDATEPLLILTRRGDQVQGWDPISGQARSIEDLDLLKVDWSVPEEIDGVRLHIDRREIHCLDVDSSERRQTIVVGDKLHDIAVGDVDCIQGPELVTLNNGWVQIWDVPSQTQILRFHVGEDWQDIALVSVEGQPIQ